MNNKPKVADAPPATSLPSYPPAPPPLEDTVKKLAEKSAALNALDDRLGQAILRVESALQGRVAIRLVETLWFDQDECTYEDLVYGKHNGKWGLFIEQGTVNSHSGEAEVDEISPLSNCSREKRSQVFAGAHLENMLRNGLSKFDGEIKSREAALAAAERVISAVSSLNHQPASSSKPDDEPRS